MIARLMSLVCFLGLVGCAELSIQNLAESGEGALDRFEVSQDRTYLAIPVSHQLARFGLGFRPVLSDGQIEPCSGRLRCENGVSFGPEPGPNGHRIFRTGPSGVQYRIVSLVPSRRGTFAFVGGSSFGDTITPRSETFLLAVEPGTVNVIGFDIEASAREVQDVRATLESRYGAAAAALTIRSVNERPIACQSQTASERLAGARPSCRVR